MTTTTGAEYDVLRTQVRSIVQKTPILDIHTHLYDPAFGPLLLWGIDDLLVYHYLVAEAFRYFPFPYETFWKLSKQQQAELIWQELFVNHSPVSEACRGVVTTLNALGLDVNKRDLTLLRDYFSQIKPRDYVTRCMELSNVRKIWMTNSPFDDVERPFWENGFERDSRFEAALRIDPLLVNWQDTHDRLRESGYEVTPDFSGRTIQEVRRFLREWSEALGARYMMVSLPPSFTYPSNNPTSKLISEAVLPECRELGLPFAVMMGVKRAVNPQLQMAGDGMGRSDLIALQNLCDAHPQNKFLATVLSRENQHELCVVARKFRNLHIFGCWWFTNIPSVIDDMTRMRLELIGLSCTPQHSDARVLDQIIYKWRHSREIIAEVLSQKYVDLARSGWRATPAEIERDVALLFGGSFEEFCRM
ncbi:MAG TPA: glucuronate isomerase [Methylomirabilota bacterium]|nr:glucuronate isomerase [Methylomirabilota bacterium]